MFGCFWRFGVVVGGLLRFRACAGSGYLFNRVVECPMNARERESEDSFIRTGKKCIKRHFL